jgi:hypothetical protein
MIRKRIRLFEEAKRKRKKKRKQNRDVAILAMSDILCAT